MEAVHILGAGGIGVAVGHALATAGIPLLMVDSRADKVRHGNAKGLCVEGYAPRPAPFVEWNDWQPTPETLVLLCTKCPVNSAILTRLPVGQPLVPIQNGVDEGLLQRRPFVEGIASFVSECHPDQPSTRITRPGRLHIGIHPAENGCLDPRLRHRVLHLSGLLRHGPFRTTIVEDIRPIKHAKLMYNAALCPLAAIAGLDNGALLRERPLRELFFALLRENHAILQRAGLPLGQVGPLPTGVVAGILSRPWLADALAWLMAPSLTGTYCSMASDLGPNGPAHGSEIENYNGYLLRLANSMPAPINRAVVHLVRRLERDRLPPSRQWLEELLPLRHESIAASATTESNVVSDASEG